MTGYLLEIGQALVALALAPGLVGFIRWWKARLQGRRGAPPWFVYYDLRKLFGKEVVMSKNASWIFRFTPYLVFHHHGSGYAPHPIWSRRLFHSIASVTCC